MAAAILACLEIGSTYTKLVTFREQSGRLAFCDRQATRTTVRDVRDGAHQLLGQIGHGYDVAYLTSSAAGGLRVAVCGLTPTLSTKVGREVALGAGGVVVYSSSGRLSPRDVRQLEQASPSLVLITGGTDDGESSAVLSNVTALASADFDAVFVFAGNSRVAQESHELLTQAGKRCVITGNVYPEGDHFRFDEVRDLIRVCYEQDVTKARGVDELCADLKTTCLPTPLAVSRTVEALGEQLGGVLALDVGGATTDVHSFSDTRGASEAIQATFEPRLKRTVEGDLGVYHNLENLLLQGEAPPAGDEPLLDANLVGSYALRAARQGIARHCGHGVDVHGAGGVRQVVYGADLRGVGTVVATGGALRHGLREARELEPVLQSLSRSRLVPQRVHSWLVDRRYLMSSLGSLLPGHAEAVGTFIDEGLKEGTWS